MRKNLKYMFLLLGIIINTASAEEKYGTPVSICLNEHTIPFINTDKPAIEIVDAAYEQCRGVLLQWDEERQSLPPDMIVKQNKEFHAFYVHMIEVRRKVIKKTN